MKSQFIKCLITTAVLTALTACGSDNDGPLQEICEEHNCTKFTVLHTNDNHGRFWENKHGEYGMAARKALVDQIRAEVTENGGQTLLFSGGDINTGVPESDMQDAEPDFFGMNLIGYDAMAVGNHEFDNALEVMDKQRRSSDFPWLAANIYKTELDENNAEQLVRYFDAYKIFDVNGLKIAVIGLITKDTETIGNPDYIEGFVFTDPKDEIKKVIAEIKEANAADIIFAATHMGHYADGQSGDSAPGDVAMARALEKGQLQAVFGGHTSNPVCMEAGTNNYADFQPGDACLPDQQNGTYIMNAEKWGKYVARADFEVVSGEVRLVSYNLIPVNLKVKDENGNRVLVGKEIKPDLYVKALLHPYQAKGDELLGEKVATTEAELSSKGSNEMQNQLGHLIGESHRLSVGSGADFAVMNAGGIRAPFEAGDITYRDVLTVQPFSNSITINTMTGKEVNDYLNVIASIQEGDGGYAQLRGVEMVVDCEAKTVDISKLGGKTFSPTDTYSFTVPSYSASGGDGYPKLTNAIDTGIDDALALKAHLEAIKHVAASDYQPVAGDIQYTNSESVSACKTTK
ncbi:5'-nucleotidase [Shewanella halifaxensis HAW-EB4]|uniref:5'-nucleotidase n=1 Tax=Shewanella halifaxensis (strain HAW-EB4) TaxID=458817 RepID=B0TS02_SHEHH|nr:bifunctional UDP-sugar hydrolase/5'-nucleotidase UshA [Shewanella halifaxensis]ABZ77914.1 5'-nucleotidase [Shewanella halifaxensis HAW-EB4]